MAQKRLKASTLREQPRAELQTKLNTLQQELWQARLKTRDGALQQTHQLRALRRDIARVHTVLRSTS